MSELSNGVEGMQKLYTVYHPEGWSFTGPRREALIEAEHYCKLFGKDLDDIKGSSVFSTDYITKPGNGFLIILVSVIILLLLIVIGWRVITSSRNNTSPREEYRF